MNEKKGPSGLLVGLIIGGAIGALLSTKKGRQILKDIAEYGLDYVGNTVSIDDIENILNNEEEEVMDGEMEAGKKPVNEKAEESEEPSRRRRLFKGIRRSS